MQSANLAMDWPSSMLIDDQGGNQTRVLRTSEITEQMWFPCEVYGRTAKCRSCATQGLDHPVGESPKWHIQQHKISCTSTDEMKYIKVHEKDSRFI